jgi:signal recognition particle receptor subunit beta
MEINTLNKFENEEFEDLKGLDVMDVPGLGFYKQKIIETLPNAKLIILFVDSNEKQNIALASEYLYDILNNENFDDMINIIVACNKQDLKFSKNKKLIESEMSNEIENIKQIKQKNNLDDSSTLGTLFNMKTKFKFDVFKNVHFVDTEKNSKYELLIEKIKELINSK